MTLPKVQTLKRGSSRYYVHPTTGAKHPGVTSILNMLPKPFLKRWGEKLVATAAVEILQDAATEPWLATMARKDPEAAIDYLKNAPYRSTRAAADQGTALHAIAEDRIRGHQVVPHHDPVVNEMDRQYQALLDELQPELLRAEETVWDDEWEYAGTFDALLKLGDVVAWTDVKTTKSGVYPEVALQLSAYSHAQKILTETGDEVVNVYNPAYAKEDIRGLVFHIRPEQWSVYEVPIDSDVFGYFCSLRHIFDWDANSRTVIGKPVLKGIAFEQVAHGRASNLTVVT